MKRYEAIVVGVSAGSLKALSIVLSALPEKMSVPVIVVAHRAADSDSFLASHLNELSKATVREAEYGALVQPGIVYLAPAGYHVHVESGRSCGVRPSYASPWTNPSISSVRPWTCSFAARRRCMEKVSWASS